MRTHASWRAFALAGAIALFASSARATITTLLPDFGSADGTFAFTNVVASRDSDCELILSICTEGAASSTGQGFQVVSIGSLVGGSRYSLSFDLSSTLALSAVEFGFDGIANLGVSTHLLLTGAGLNETLTLDGVLDPQRIEACMAGALPASSCSVEGSRSIRIPIPGGVTSSSFTIQWDAESMGSGATSSRMFNSRVRFDAIPEPDSALLFGAGFLLVGAGLNRRRAV